MEDDTTCDLKHPVSLFLTFLRLLSFSLPPLICLWEDWDFQLNALILEFSECSVTILRHNLGSYTTGCNGIMAKKAAVVSNRHFLKNSPLVHLCRETNGKCICRCSAYAWKCVGWKCYMTVMLRAKQRSEHEPWQNRCRIRSPFWSFETLWPTSTCRVQNMWQGNLQNTMLLTQFKRIVFC